MQPLILEKYNGTSIKTVSLKSPFGLSVEIWSRFSVLVCVVWVHN